MDSAHLRHCVIGLTALTLLAAALPADDLPRYQFSPGRELVYRQTSKEDLLKTDENAERQVARHEWRIYPVRRNDDGSWRLLVRRLFQILRDPVDGDPTVVFENDFMGYCDLQPDGSYEKNETCGYNPLFQLHPEEIFCQLPASEDELASGWEFTTPTSDAYYVLKVESGGAGDADGDELRFSGNVTNAEDVNYELTKTNTFRFDRRRGILRKIERESKADSSVNLWHIRSTVELIAEEPHDAEWLARLVKEADDYFDVDQVWWEAIEGSESTRTRAACEEALGRIRNRLVELQENATVPLMQELYRVRLKLHDIKADGVLESAQKREELYGRPPLDWETTDFDEKEHRLVDYRGQIVVMDFWYRGCGHCIKAIPKIKGLAETYRDKPVVVMGINNDQEDDNARFVIETFELEYPNLRNGEISKGYDVYAWPTLIVLDQSGRVILFHEGNTEHLVQEVSQVVDELLSNPPSDE